MASDNLESNKLSRELPDFKKGILLNSYTTFRVGGPAKYFYQAKTKDDLIKAVKTAKKLNLPFFILGGGSNLLVSDKGYRGLVIKTKNSKIELQNDDLKFKINCQAGTMLSEIISFTFKNNLSGMEWAIGIPGTVAGAIYGNAGSFNGSIADSIKSVEVFDGLKVKTFKNKDCLFNYRESIFKKNKNLIILSAELIFDKGKKKEIEKMINQNLVEKKKRQPLRSFSAGSVFKNPENFYFEEEKRGAGWLIEKCGLKGKIIGRAEISQKHAGFIINLDNAKAQDIKELIWTVKKEVKRKFKVNLEEEIGYLGFKK